MKEKEVALILKELHSWFHNYGGQLQLMNEKLDIMEQRLARIEETLEAYIQQNRREDQQLMQTVRSWVRKSRLKLSEP